MRLVASIVLAACSHHDPAPPPTPGPIDPIDSIDPIEPTTWTVPIRPTQSPPRETLASPRDGLGKYYGRARAFAGRVDSAHNFYDANGMYVGRRNDDGSFFDAHGNYAGRIDVSNNLYSATGARTGTWTPLIAGVCDDDCRNDAAANVVLAR